jgi:dipeptidyl aminopeptidase/acylaminoacyl peptidase
MRQPYLLLLFFWATFAAAQTVRTPVSVTDLTRLKTVSGITLSPDGKRAIYAVQSIEPNEEAKLEYEYRTHLWLTDFVNPPRQLTRGTESVSRASWSPDGRQLVFSRPVRGKSQLFVMPLDGGEAYQLTNVRYGAGNPRWSPDGRQVLFSVGLSLRELTGDSLFNPDKTVPGWSLEKPGLTNAEVLRPDAKIKGNPDGTLAEIRAYLAQNEVDKKAKVINRLNFQGEATTQPELQFSHLMLIEPREGARPVPLTRGFQSYAGTWLGRGGWLALTTQAAENQHPDRAQGNKVQFVRLTERQPLVATSPSMQQSDTRYVNPTDSPDGRWLALLTSPGEGVGFPTLALAALTAQPGSGAPQAGALQPVAFDRAAGNLTWSPDSKYLYFTAPTNGGVPLYRLDVATRTVEQLTDLESGVTDFDVAGDKLVFARTQVSAPSDLYVATLTAAAPAARGRRATGTPADGLKAALQSAKVLTNLNDWVANRTLSVPEKRSFQNERGQTVEYWIMKPSTLEAGKRYPLVLNMHGGPTAMWGPGEASMWHEFQYLCSRGYGVVYANPRGSGGYGLEFQRANIKDWGTGPAADVLRATTEAAREAWVDTARQVITGGSYAGYLTAWIIAHDDRFKAAFAQRGVYDLTTFLGEGNAWRLVPGYFQYPWLDKTEGVLAANSPYTFVDKIRTPLLIKHGENDLRTGVIQSEMMYKSLKILGRDVEYVRMPGGTHELSRSGNVRQRIDRLLRIYEFFERYVGAGRLPETRGPASRPNSGK